MSIIQDALKKAEDPGDVKKDVPPAEPPRAAPARAVHGRGRFRAVVVSVISVLCAVGVVILWLTAKHAVPASKAPQASLPASHQEVTVTQLPPESAPAARPAPSTEEQAASTQFILNGIMYLPDNPQAIINDSVVEEGGSVSGAVVKKIERNQVTLEYNNVEVTLKLKN